MSDFQNVLKMNKFGPIVLEFLVEIKYFRYFVEYVMYIFSWKDPFYTFQSLTTFSFIIWFFEMFLVVMAILAWTPMKDMCLSFVLKACRRRKENLDEKVSNQRLNFAFIQWLQQGYLDALREVERHLYSEDKTKIVLVFHIMRYLPFAIIMITYINPRILIMLLLWISVWANHPWSKNFIEKCTKKVKKILKIKDKSKI